MIEGYKCTDDMGSLSEIYTIEELISRLSVSTYPTSQDWRARWLKNVSIYRDVMYDTRYAAYYGIPVIRINPVTNKWERIPPLTLSQGG